MREIKFRAWDKRNNKWFHPDLIIMTKAGFYEDYRAFEDGNSLFDYEYELMQYTGLKVNNEKCLYEGDIVPVNVSIHKGWKQGWVHLNKNAVVEYVESEMRFMFAADVEGFGKQYITFDKSIRQSYKIIGNIYENPELLEGA